MRDKKRLKEFAIVNNSKSKLPGTIKLNSTIPSLNQGFNNVEKQ